MRRTGKRIKPGDVTITLRADDRPIAEQYAPPSVSIRRFIERERKRRRVRVLDVAARVMFHFYLLELKLAYPPTFAQLVDVAEKELARVEDEERRSSRAYAIPG